LEDKRIIYYYPGSTKGVNYKYEQISKVWVKDDPDHTRLIYSCQPHNEEEIREFARRGHFHDVELKQIKVKILYEREQYSKVVTLEDLLTPEGVHIVETCKLTVHKTIPWIKEGEREEEAIANNCEV